SVAVIASAARIRTRRLMNICRYIRYVPTNVRFRFWDERCISREDRRNVRECSCEKPAQQQHDWRVKEEMQDRVSGQMERLDVEDSHQRQHPEWIDQVRQRL